MSAEVKRYVLKDHQIREDPGDYWVADRFILVDDHSRIVAELAEAKRALNNYALNPPWNRVLQLEAALRYIGNACNLSDDETDVGITYRECFPAETPVAQSKSQQKRFEAQGIAHVPFESSTNFTSISSQSASGSETAVPSIQSHSPIVDLLIRIRSFLVGVPMSIQRLSKMGMYVINCPTCKEPHYWFSGNLDQRCHECQAMAKILDDQLKRSTDNTAGSPK